VLGYYGRWLALPLAADLLGAIVLVHGKAGFFFTNPKGGWEYLALWIVGLSPCSCSATAPLPSSVKRRASPEQPESPGRAPGGFSATSVFS
jgi:hypothetical protein